jgi:hypothetical protein
VSVVDPNLDIIIGGSYTYGACSSDDINCLLSKKHASASHELLHFFIDWFVGLLQAGSLSRLRSGTAVVFYPVNNRNKFGEGQLLLVPETKLGSFYLAKL